MFAPLFFFLLSFWEVLFLDIFPVHSFSTAHAKTRTAGELGLYSDRTTSVKNIPFSMFHYITKLFQQNST